MASTPLLGLSLPADGTTNWGTLVNTSITALLDSAVAGTTALTTDVDVTLSTTTEAANQARQAVILCTGSRAALRTITAPAQSKTYVIINATTGGFGVKIVGVGPTTGVTVPSGKAYMVAWNGSDFVPLGLITVSLTTDVTGVLPVANGGTNSTATPTAGAVPYGTGTAYAFTSAGTSGQALRSGGSGAPTFGTLGTGAGGTGLTTFSANQLFYASSSSAIGQSANLQFVNSNLSINGITVGRSSGNVSTNTAVGISALAGNSTGNNNTAIGTSALASNTSGSTNTAIGADTLYLNTTGGGNTAIGPDALYFNTTGSFNTAVGKSALTVNSTGDGNTALGGSALGSNTTGIGNTALGYAALLVNTTGRNNVAIGQDALGSNTTGSGNTMINPTNSTGGYNPVFNPSTQSDRFCMGSTAVTNAYIQVAWTVVSDARDKINFAPVPHGLAFVNQLKPTQFQFAVSRTDPTPHGPVRYGFKAQDILALEGNNPVIIDAENPEKLRYQGESLVPVLVKAIQELSARIEALEAK